MDKIISTSLRVGMYQFPVCSVEMLELAYRDHIAERNIEIWEWAQGSDCNIDIWDGSMEIIYNNHSSIMLFLFPLYVQLTKGSWTPVLDRVYSVGMNDCSLPMGICFLALDMRLPS